MLAWSSDKVAPWDFIAKSNYLQCNLLSTSEIKSPQACETRGREGMEKVGICLGGKRAHGLAVSGSSAMAVEGRGSGDAGT